MTLLDKTADALAQVVHRTAARLQSLDPELVRRKPAPGKWSIQEIFGHLVDSATNNHQRFIRAQQQDPLVFPKYEQDDWVQRQGYNDAAWPDLLDLWRLYNLHLAEVIRRVPADRLPVRCTIGPLEPVSLEFLITDYLDHLEHHLAKVEQMLAAPA